MSRRDQHASPRGRRWAIRPDLNLTQLATRLGCSLSHLSEVLNGRKGLSAGLANKLALELGVPPLKLPDMLKSWAAQAAVLERRRAAFKPQRRGR